MGTWGTRLPLYLLGALFFSLGATAFIEAGLGTDPLDVLSLGLIEHISWMTIGIAQASFAAICIGIWSVWNKRRPTLTPFITFLFCGTMIDLFTRKKIREGRNVAGYLHLGPWPTMLIGLAACAYGSSLIIMSGFGIRAMDLLALTAFQKKRVPFWLGKGVLELLLLGIGWTLGGPVGWGTVAFLIIVGWTIQPIIWANRKFLSLPDFGLNLHQPIA